MAGAEAVERGRGPRVFVLHEHRVTALGHISWVVAAVEVPRATVVAPPGYEQDNR
jgi:hypothetical protein